MAISSSMATSFLGNKLGAHSFPGVLERKLHSRGTIVAMAKGGKSKTGRVLIRLISTADTGFFFVSTKNPRNSPQKLELVKFDPRAGKRVPFREATINKPKSNKK
ncbi:uncharacterized protein LOC9657961 [Selaginella moellendorffii]|nr:uncharacterized protein LOC9657961 [Selaginella moellendorffii]|eukprot:XP_002981187.2 uncharacterized protein LOC9657961 [Selaginella moellendorffii]